MNELTLALAPAMRHALREHWPRRQRSFDEAELDSDPGAQVESVEC